MDSPETHKNQYFPPTRWSLLLESQRADPAVRQEALESLCRAYWQPLYAYARYRGHRAEDAKDLIQGFFAGLFSRDGLQHVDETKGKLRTFLLVSLNNHITSEWKAAACQKRGGGIAPISIDTLSAEEHYRSEFHDTHSPEKMYERQWALTLLECVLERLRQSYIGEGKHLLFEALEDVLVRDTGAPTYQEIADGLGKTETAIKTSCPPHAQTLSEIPPRRGQSNR